MRSEEIDDGEEGDPDDVERVPKQAEAQETAEHVRPEALGEDLRHHREEPEEACSDMEAVTADKSEEGREEGAARRAGAAVDEIPELHHLQRNEGRAEHECH